MAQRTLPVCLVFVVSAMTGGPARAESPRKRAEAVAALPVQGASGAELESARRVVEATLVRWSPWPRVPQVVIDGIGMVAGSEAALACDGSPVCAGKAARLVDARWLLFTRVDAAGVRASLLDAAGSDVPRVVDVERRDAQLDHVLEAALVLVMDPESAAGTLVGPAGASAALDGKLQQLPARVSAGWHSVKVGSSERAVLVRPGASVPILGGEAMPMATGPGRLPGALVAGTGAAMAVLGLGAAAVAAGLAAGALERRWTAAQPDRMDGSARLQAWVLFQAGWLERSALAALLVAAALGLGGFMGVVSGAAWLAVAGT